jgi:hypothetical protein
MEMKILIKKVNKMMMNRKMMMKMKKMMTNLMIMKRNQKK